MTSEAAGQMPASGDPGWDGIVAQDETLATLPRHIARAFDRRYADPSERCAHKINELLPGIIPDQWIEDTYGPSAGSA